MKPPTKSPPPPPPGDENQRRQASARQAGEQPPDRGAVKRPGGHGGYKLGGEAAVGHRWHEAPAPPPATMTRFDDGVPHRHHEPGEEDPLHNEDVDHEHSDINVRAVIGSAIILAVVVIVAQVLMWGLFEVFESRAKANDPVVSPLAPAAADMPRNTQASPFFNASVGGPQLMVNEPRNLARQRDQEQKRLHGYGWVNQPGGVAYIPIDEAKKLIRERGLPVREGETAPPTLGTRAPSRGEASGGRMMVLGGDPAAAPSEPHAPAQPEKPAGDAPAAKPHGPGGH
jgi:hypothetical protein